MLSDDQLYVLYRLSFHFPRGEKWEAHSRELDLIREAHGVLDKEFRARAEEDGRIDAELALLEVEYEGIE
jgi:hypothetical protein